MSDMKNIYCLSCNRPYYEPFTDLITPIISLGCGSESRCGSCARKHVLYECQTCMDAAINYLSHKIPHTCSVCKNVLGDCDGIRYISCMSDSNLFNVCPSCAMSHIRNCSECSERLPIGTTRFYPNHLPAQLYRILNATRRALMCG